jgi:hypothetical protein
LLDKCMKHNSAKSGARPEIILEFAYLSFGFPGACKHYYYYFFFFTPWSESASELYRPSDRRFSAK